MLIIVYFNSVFNCLCIHYWVYEATSIMSKRKIIKMKKDEILERGSSLVVGSKNSSMKTIQEEEEDEMEARLSENEVRERLSEHSHEPSHQ